MQTSTNSINRDSLQEAYIESIIDGMDHKSMYQFVYDALDGNLDDYTTEELVTEVKDYYPELLEQNNDWSLKLTVTPKPFFSKLMQTSTKMNESDLFELKKNYVNLIIDGMDIGALCDLAFDALSTTYDEYSDEQIRGEIKEFYGDETLNDLMPKSE